MLFFCSMVIPQLIIVDNKKCSFAVWSLAKFEKRWVQPRQSPTQSSVLTSKNIFWQEKLLGMPVPTKTDEFSEKYQTAFDPPPSFSENHVADFATKVRMFIMAGLLCIIWSYIPWDACSTTVQYGKLVKKHTLKRPFCIIFMLKKALFKGPNFAI